MSEMVLLFEQVDALTAQLQRLNRPAADMLQPGIAPYDVEDAVAVAGPAPDDLVSMYGRHDGVDLPVGRTLGDGHVIPGFYWMPIAEAAEHYRTLGGLADLWPTRWFPVLTDGGGGYLAVICDAESEDYGCVVEVLPGEDEHEIVFDSVSMLLATAVRCFEQGAYRLKGGFLDEDYDLAGQIADQLNAARRTVDVADYR
ncbi:MAG: SMI1/KNR4 family protein [Caulobacter sp.]|nr:SMI1/KNR4 family protein [Caulobacter sp.]